MSLDNEGEPCQRCGDIGEDRRTLTMACFYAMNELNLPFVQAAIEGSWKNFSHTERTLYGQRAQFHAAEGAAREHQFYTLRVCKPCRASWMAGIQRWFNAPCIDDRPATGTGVYRRDLGATVEASADEVSAMRNGATIVALETLTIYQRSKK